MICVDVGVPIIKFGGITFVIADYSQDNVILERNWLATQTGILITMQEPTSVGSDRAYLLMDSPPEDACSGSIYLQTVSELSEYCKKTAYFSNVNRVLNRGVSDLWPAHFWILPSGHS